MSGNLAANKYLIEQLNGNIHIIPGNHDTDNRINMYHSCKNVFDVHGYAEMLKYEKYRFYLSHYPTNTANYDDSEDLKSRVINLCGHIHSTDAMSDIKEGYLRYHVEVDAHNCYPVPITDIIEELKSVYTHHCTCGGKCGGNCKCKK
jgi:calcineurin-like phosphoesterase family protein